MIVQEYQRRQLTLQKWVGRTRWHVPFERNPNFTGRKELLNTLLQKLDQKSPCTKIIAIMGLGGVGKTQLVLGLIHFIREQYAVFWIPVNSRANLQAVYYELAKELCLPGCDKNGTHILESVQEYLSGESIGPWLLVLDNADDFGLWNSPISLELGGKCLLDLLPKNTQGSIIFTTRNRKATNDFVHDMVEVPEMDEPEAMHSLKAIAGFNELAVADCQVVSALLKKLTYLPLAIVQAASYIRKNRVSFSRYTDMLDKEYGAIDLLAEEFHDTGRYHDGSNAVAKTWNISFHQIRIEDSLAAEYLSLMACVNPKDIPQSLLARDPMQNKEIKAIGTLDAYSFIKRHSGSSTFDTHRLVHLATRQWLKEHNRLSSFRGKIVLQLRELLANVLQTNYLQFRVYISHAQFAIMDYDRTRDEIVYLTQACGDYLQFDGQYQEAERMYRITFGCEKNIPGPEHPSTFIRVNNLNNIGVALEGQGKYKDAEKMYQQALTHGLKVFWARASLFQPESRCLLVHGRVLP